MTYTRWIVELDYSADPDMDVDTVRKNLQEELNASKGTPVMLTGSTIIFDRTDDAFNVRMRFAENVIAVEKEVEDEFEFYAD